MRLGEVVARRWRCPCCATACALHNQICELRPGRMWFRQKQDMLIRAAAPNGETRPWLASLRGKSWMTNLTAAAGRRCGEACADAGPGSALSQFTVAALRRLCLRAGAKRLVCLSAWSRAWFELHFWGDWEGSVPRDLMRDTRYPASFWRDPLWLQPPGGEAVGPISSSAYSPVNASVKFAANAGEPSSAWITHGGVDGGCCWRVPRVCPKSSCCRCKVAAGRNVFLLRHAAEQIWKMA